MSDDSAPLLKLEMLSQPRLLAGARAMVGNVAGRLGFSETHCSQITLAVDEALCNVINHGYKQRPDGKIWMTVAAIEDGTQPAQLRITIEDRADAVDPESIQPRDLKEIRPGGLGVHIMREVMDEVRYERRDGGGMRVTLSKKVPIEEHSQAITIHTADPSQAKPASS